MRYILLSRGHVCSNLQTLRRKSCLHTWESVQKNCIRPGSTRTEQPRRCHSRIAVQGGFSCQFQPLEKCFQGGNGATVPPFWHDYYFQPTRKGGRVFVTHPKCLVLQQKIIANALQNAAKRCKTPQNAAKRHKTPQNTAKHHKTPQNTAKHRKTPQNTAKHRKTQQNTAKHSKTPQNTATHRKRAHGRCQFAAKCRKTPQNAAKRRKYCELAISLRGTKYLGGLKKPAPFSGLLKLIVDHNWGAAAPFPP